MEHDEAFDPISYLIELRRPKNYEEFESYLLNKKAIILSELVMLFSRGNPSVELEKEFPDLDMEYLEEFKLYLELIEEFHGGFFPVTQDLHIPKRFRVKLGNLAEVILKLYKSKIRPCGYMNRFIEKWCGKEAVGLFSAVARKLLQTEEFRGKAKRALSMNSPKELKGISKAIDSDPSLAILKDKYITSSNAKKNSARDTLTKQVKEEMFKIIRSKEFTS